MIEIDLPNLQSITLGNEAFAESVVTILESISRIKYGIIIRSSFITKSQSQSSIIEWKRRCSILFVDNAKYELYYI